ncbi:hypothetical protein H3C22_17295 [Vibrio cholerae]|uniref:hypothetical protein n=1 Tax=Vibrio cholerae TaxID=666 RepID=UPI001EC28916|nr:hypothetical protein [Vibrio cholerae]EGR4299698.1 hypothetical protein [Vibrio cholerae]ELJ8527830.1 hypothetical protein [Vibrio cholerae]
MKLLDNNTHKLAKNPLGIIALFIVLIYGIAGLVLGTSSNDLENYHKSVLIWFFAIFPFSVLFSFVWLVSKHHSKLYGPSDFRNDEGFLKAATPKEQRDKLEQEAKEFASDPDSKKGENSTKLKIGAIKENIVLYEDLALRELESVFGERIIRHVILPNGPVLDGWCVRDGVPNIIEVKYLGGRINTLTFDYNARELAKAIKNQKWSGMRLIYVFIIDESISPGEEFFSNKARSLSDSVGIEVEYRALGMQALKEKHGLGNKES